MYLSKHLFTNEQLLVKIISSHSGIKKVVFFCLFVSLWDFVLCFCFVYNLCLLALGFSQSWTRIVSNQEML